MGSCKSSRTRTNDSNALSVACRVVNGDVAFAKSSFYDSTFVLAVGGWLMVVEVENASLFKYPQFESDFCVTVATPTGSEWYDFYGNIYNVSANTKYYIRTYARYKTDSIRYGNVVEYETY